MSGLGSFIHQQRKKKKMTRNALASGICSEKTIYYIEMDKRLPSVNIMSQLGSRLGLDIFEYLPYLEYKEPIEVKEALEKLERMRSSKYTNELKTYLSELENLPDFKEKPLIEHIEYNRLFCAVNEKPTKAHHEMLCKVLKTKNVSLPILEDSPDHEDYMTQRYANLLGIYYMKKGKNEDGIHIFRWLSKQIEIYSEVRRLQEHYIAIKLNYLHALRIAEEYEGLLNEASALLKYMKKIGNNDKDYICLWFKAISYRKLENIEKSVNEIVKMLYSGYLKFDLDDIAAVFTHVDFEGIRDFITKDELWSKALEQRLGRQFWNNSSIES